MSTDAPAPAAQEPRPAVEKLVIIGSGPAAHTAAIYAARANLRPLMYEGMMAAGVAAGGQLTTTTDVENFPGFPEGVGGYELMEKMRAQSVRWGTLVETKTVERVNLKSYPFEIFPEGESAIKALTVIISTGATAKRLHVKGEDTYWNKGISACAVCDGALPIFRNKVLIVVGGGDTAAEESTFLTHFASKVYLVVRRDALRASKAMQERVFKNSKIEILWNSQVTEAKGNGKLLTTVRIENSAKNESVDFDAAGLFYAIGHVPNTSFLEGQLKMDDTGYLITKPGTTETEIPGVFAAGDVQDKVYRQAITAAGTGCMAALEVERWLSENTNVVREQPQPTDGSKN